MIFNSKVKKTFDCDVLVVGGGVAGYGAAMGAGLAGANVILTEQNGYLGGSATAGLVCPFMTCYDTLGQEQLIKGVFDKLIRKLVQNGDAIAPEDCRKCDSFSGYKLEGHLGTTPFNREGLKVAMEQTVLETGVNIKYHYTFLQAERKGRNITSCYFATKNGIYKINAKAFIDCTGDAMVCESVGGECYFSDDNNDLQPVSTFFLIDGVDKELLDSQLIDNNNPAERAFMSAVEQAKKLGEFPCGTAKVRIYEQPYGIWSVNMCQIDKPFDVNDPDLITNAEIEGRRQCQIIFNFLKNYVTGMKNIRLLQTSESVGVRESRRIVGEYTMTAKDVQSNKRFEDTVVKLANSIDVHTSSRTVYRTYENKDYYTIPYRSLVHKDFDNVWSAGKTVSADRLALGAIRVMPPSMAMGQAAGVAASIAVKNGYTAKSTPYSTIKNILNEQGANL
ncbi:MAG: FAD-dependent oxidoreductase [Clostridia bacterium]|nr:FAD-dependent oxidoreductase [Clostridia bacterium]